MLQPPQKTMKPPKKTMKNRTLCVLSVILCALILSGCGDGNYRLSGKVTFSDDGSPVPNGAIFFTDGKSRSQGGIQSDGTYVVGTLAKTDGIPPGEYKVYFAGVSTEDNVSLIDSKYHSADASGLTFTADGKKKTFDIQLDRAK